MLIASVMCTRWSQIMRLLQSKIDHAKYAKLINEARVHLEFVCKLCKMQKVRHFACRIRAKMDVILPKCKMDTIRDKAAKWVVRLIMQKNANPAKWVYAK